MTGQALTCERERGAFASSKALCDSAMMSLVEKRFGEHKLIEADKSIASMIGEHAD